MYMYNREKNLVMDDQKRVIGVVYNGRFKQEGCDQIYKTGLSPRELEKISELMQKNGVQY